MQTQIRTHALTMNLKIPEIKIKYACRKMSISEAL